LRGDAVGHLEDHGVGAVGALDHRDAVAGLRRVERRRQHQADVRGAGTTHEGGEVVGDVVARHLQLSEQRPRGARVRAVDHDARQSVGAHPGRRQRLLERFGHERSRELGAEALLPLARERLVRRAPNVEKLLGGRALAEDDGERLVVGPERERGGAVAAHQLARPARRADHDVAHRHQRAASGRGEIVAGQQRRHPRARRAPHRRRAHRTRQVERGVEGRGVELLGVAGSGGREQQAIDGNRMGVATGRWAVEHFARRFRRHRHRVLVVARGRALAGAADRLAVEAEVGDIAAVSDDACHDRSFSELGGRSTQKH
jgi:hypothetical protein